MKRTFQVGDHVRFVMLQLSAVLIFLQYARYMYDICKQEISRPRCRMQALMKHMNFFIRSIQNKIIVFNAF